jgi:hypothetical protein
MTLGACDAVGPGGIRFYDNHVPALEVGDYVINVAQHVHPKNSPIDECHSAAQAFSVQGSRYSLPPDDVFSVFPPPDSSGIFDQFLPHVVLTKRDLPWERDVFESKSHDTRPPWMALLVFDADDPTELLDSTVAGYKPNRTRSATMTAEDLTGQHTDKSVAWPDIEAEWYEEHLDQTPCVVIDVTPKAFTALVPSPESARYLAHARQVDATAKDASVLRVAGDGWYSVVVAGRLPRGRAIAHLVSLEGLAKYLTDPSLLSGVDRVRLVSFAGWAFTCISDPGESFSDLMLGLLTAGNNVRKSTTFALPRQVTPDDPPDVQRAAVALDHGYVPLRYATRPGPQTYAWYRGPFSPVPVANFVREAQSPAGDRDAGWAPFGTASAATIYDPDSGVFDISYGTAWETGRLMALSNAAFSQELLDWQRKGHALIDMILERKAQIAALAGLDLTQPQTEEQLLELIEPYAVTGDFMKRLVTELGQQLAPQPATPAGGTAPTLPPVPPYPGLPTPPANPQTLAELLQETPVQNAIRAVGGEELDDLADWLARLQLLVGVPFDALVPHPALLPNESLRFFEVDSNWTDALVEGALSIGVESSRDRIYQDLMKDLIWDGTQTALQTLRSQLLADSGTQPPDLAPLTAPRLSGMLLRSAVVSGWPGLEVNAYSATEQDGVHADTSKPIHALRIDRLAGDVLLCLWPTVPAIVTIDEPREGVAFGVEDPPKGQTGTRIYLRSINPSGYGLPLCTDQEIEDGTCTYWIDPVAEGAIDATSRVVNVPALIGALQKKLPGAETAVNVRDVAIQLVKVPEQAVFVAPRLEPVTSANGAGTS